MISNPSEYEPLIFWTGTKTSKYASKNSTYEIVEDKMQLHLIKMLQ